MNRPLKIIVAAIPSVEAAGCRMALGLWKKMMFTMFIAVRTISGG
jgi:hypothetical protein